jgi:uncharacterized alpha-E superfamily protein
VLGRTADQLYWTARYVERAENMARMIDIGYRMALLDVPGVPLESGWASTLEVAGDPEGYAERYGEVTGPNVIRYLTLDPDYPSSIYSSIRAARENARALRATVTTEMWESLNTTWLELRDMDETRLEEAGFRDFFDWVKERALLFRGITNSTMLRDESYAFLELGLSIERSDNTARLLDSKYHILLPSDEGVGGSVDYYQWGALLRSVSAFRAYHKIYSDVVRPYRVAELLLLRRDMPRSLISCFEQITVTLDALCRDRPRECQRIAGEMYARLRYGRIDEIFQRGLHEFLTDFVERNADLGLQIEYDFMMLQ